MSRISARFAELKAQNRAGFVAFITAGDPDYDTSLEILAGLPKAGADIIELGMPFTDPMAEGPAIQASSLRALKAGQTMAKTLAMVRAFRQTDAATPIVLMGYYNPIYSYGVEKFSRDSHAAGVDGLIIVDLPPEEDHELRKPAKAAGLDLIRLATPTTDAARLPAVLEDATGFLYYVSIMGVTGTKSINPADMTAALKRIRAATSLPIAVGFGIKTEEDAVAVAKSAAAAVVGSALVSEISRFTGPDSKVSPGAAQAVLSLVRRLAGAAHRARN
ncbi:MAG: tryptophan synthase subunit alpha [Alphaproteobacteria bacterium]|nr:tryptophan synthase subunit alpha [Alphaproteobacteria bacterium]